MKRETREERRRRGQRRLQLVTYLLFLLLLLAWLLSWLAMTVEAEPPQQGAMDGRLPGDDTPALTRCYLTEEEMETAENELIEAVLLERAHVIEDCVVSHYDCCLACCGKTDGITASGVRATPGVSVAVDPAVIPLGSDVLVDYGDGEIHYYRADDVGRAIKGNRIDLCMETHEEALEAGVRMATVYWVEQGG